MIGVFLCSESAAMNMFCETAISDQYIRSDRDPVIAEIAV